MAKKKPTQSQIVAEINRYNNDYNLLESIDLSIDNFIFNNSLPDKLKEDETDLLIKLKEAQEMINDLQSTLQSWAKQSLRDLQNLK